MRKTTLETSSGNYSIYETLEGVEVYRGTDSKGTQIGDMVIGSIPALPASNIVFDNEYRFKHDKDPARNDGYVSDLVQKALAHEPYQLYSHVVIRDMSGDVVILPVTFSARDSLSRRIEKIEVAVKKRTRVRAK